MLQTHRHHLARFNVTSTLKIILINISLYKYLSLKSTFTLIFPLCVDVTCNIPCIHKPYICKCKFFPCIQNDVTFSLWLIEVCVYILVPNEDVCCVNIMVWCTLCIVNRHNDLNTYLNDDTTQMAATLNNPSIVQTVSVVIIATLMH